MQTLSQGVEEYREATCPQEEARSPTIPQAAISLIAKFEGLRLRAYADGPGRWSIGYGTESYEGEEITEAEAIRRKCEHLRPLYLRIKRGCPSCSDGQLAALLSFGYNVGEGALLRSELWQRTVTGQDVEDRHFEQWSYHNGKHYKGLLLRRQAEMEVYLNEQG